MRTIFTLLLLIYASIFFGQINRTREIKEVIITNQSDIKAIALLKKVKKNYKKNSPKSLDSYEFLSYQKISFDVDQDSISDYKKFLQHRKDSLKIVGIKENQTSEEKKDSLEEIQLMNIAQESQFFLWERAQQYLFSKTYGEKINLLDNRISGLKNPIYELLTLRTNLYKLPREVRPENFYLYQYHLKDDITYKDRANYVIKFRERKNKKFENKQRYNGYIYIDKATLGITKIESNSREQSKGNIRSEWVLKNGKWFLDNEYVKINLGTQEFELNKTKDENGKTKTITQKYGNYIYLKSKFFDIKTPSNATAKDFKGYTYSIKNTDGSLMEKYRTDSLSAREKNAYIKIDSLGKTYKIEQKIGLLTGLTKGKIRTGMIDWDIRRLISFNQYEGFRLGAGGKLNEKFSKVFSPNAYFAYGLKDKAWKYGVGLDIKTSQNRNALFRLSYADDVTASGKFNQIFWSNKMRRMNTAIGIHNSRYFSFKKYQIAYEQDFWNSISTRITAKKMKTKAEFLYQYKNEANLFYDTSLIFSLKFSPNSKNVMTPTGKFTYKRGYPEVFFNYEKGLKTFDGQFDYHRFDLLFIHLAKTDIGVTKIRLYGGYLQGDVPIYNAFEMGGLKNNSSKLRAQISLSTYLGFATMESGKYFNDRFVAYYLSHRLPFNFTALKKGISNIDLVYKGEIGDFKNTDIHHFDFQKLNHLYQEIGFEYNNFLNTKLNLGFFYRVGYYHQPKFMDNFAIQFKFRLLGF